MNQIGEKVCVLREEQAESLYRAKLVHPVGRGVKVRCLMLNPCVSKAAVFGFLRGGRWSTSQASQTVKLARVGPQRMPVYEHLERSLGFGGTDSLPIVTARAPKGTLTEVALNVGTSLQLLTSGPREPEVEAPMQVIPIERGSNDAEKEPEGVIVEPTTPVVAVPAKQAQHITASPVTILEPEAHDISALRKLGAAVLVKAFEDARTDSKARRWFEQTPQPMLTFWCQVVGLDVERVRKQALATCAGQ